MSAHDFRVEPASALWAGVGATGYSHHSIPSGAIFRVPAGFHGYSLPTIDTQRSTVYRNWSRVAGMRKSAHVLVLDGDVNVLDILGQSLDGDGYNVTLSHEALRLEEIQRLRPHVIIAEASFAKDGGDASLIHRISDDGFAFQPMLMLCTSNPGFARPWSTHGVHTVLKPFDLDEVMELIAHATG